MTEAQREQNEEFRDRVMDCLKEHGAWYEVAVYCNGRKYVSEGLDSQEAATHMTGQGTPYYDCGEWDVADVLPYHNAESLTLTFEGPLYHMINYGDGTIEDALNKIADDYGQYLEGGYAWSLAFYS